MRKINKQEQTRYQGKSGISLFIGLALFVGLMAVGGCNTNSANSNTAAPKNTAEKANTATTKTEAPAGTILKPGDVSPDKTIKVYDLVDSIVADKDGWKGKEVSITAYVSASASSGKNVTLTLINDQAGNIKKGLSCTFQGEKAAGDAVFSKTVEVKGKISYISTDGEYKTIGLDPCEIKK